MARETMSDVAMADDVLPTGSPGVDVQPAAATRKGRATTARVRGLGACMVPPRATDVPPVVSRRFVSKIRRFEGQPPWTSNCPSFDVARGIATARAPRQQDEAEGDTRLRRGCRDAHPAERRRRAGD